MPAQRRTPSRDVLRASTGLRRGRRRVRASAAHREVQGGRGTRAAAAPRATREARRALRSRTSRSHAEARAELTLRARRARTADSTVPTPRRRARAAPARAVSRATDRTQRRRRAAAATRVRGRTAMSLEFTLPPGELDRVFIDPGARTRIAAPQATAAPSTRRHEGEAPSGARHAGSMCRTRAPRLLSGLRSRRARRFDAAAARLAVAWRGAAAVLCAALLVQMIHDNRAWLAAHGPLRGPLQSSTERSASRCRRRRISPPINCASGASPAIRTPPARCVCGRVS